MPRRAAPERLVLVFAVLVSTLALLTPLCRAFRHAEFSYNEGWNVAAAMRLDHGGAHDALLPVNTARDPLGGGCCQTELYPAAWGWTTVNYPVLSFAALAALHGMTGDYLYTARAVSLLALLTCAVLVGLVAYALGATRRAALLAALLTVAIFSVCAIDYVGVDDPQLLGDALFLFALFVYVWPRRSGSAVEATHGRVALTAALFVCAGCVKQSPIDFPLALLLDLLLLSRRKLFTFVASAAVVGVFAAWLNMRLGGPWFAQELLLGRLYSATKARDVAISVLGPMLVPFVLAAIYAWRVRRDPRRRIAALLLVTSVVLGGYFGGGSGVAGNTLFTALFAIVLLLGLFFADAERQPRTHAWRSPAVLLPVVSFAWLITPALVQGIANPVRNLRDAAAAERRFFAETALLRGHAGPALCESILRCLAANKPYVYDPFNATRLLLQHKLDEGALLDDIAAQRFSAVQLHAPITGADDALFAERFPASALRAIAANYTLALQDEDTAIYLPRTAAHAAASPSTAPSR